MSRKREDWIIIKRGKFTQKRACELCLLNLYVTTIKEDIINEGRSVEEAIWEPLMETYDFLTTALTDHFLILVNWNTNRVYMEVFVSKSRVKIIPLYFSNQYHGGYEIILDHDSATVQLYAHKRLVSETKSKRKDEFENLLLRYNVTLFGWAINEIKVAMENQCYPVEVYEAPKKKGERGWKPHIKHSKKPWMYGDLVTVKFMDRLPYSHTDKEHQGGHHASPRIHVRKAHTRVLRHPRYRNHPLYLKPMHIEDMVVGKDTSIIGGITYKVSRNILRENRGV